jgi:uncharacterized protein
VQTPRVLAATLIVGILSQGLLASFPASAGRVNDFAGVLDTTTKTQIETIIREAERITSAQMAVATVSSLEGMSVEEYANRLFHEWGIGKKALDNGVLVLVAPNERKVRIEVGYGLEPLLPDGLAGEIIRTEILPRFRENDYAGGTLAAITRIAGIVQRGHVLTSDERRQYEQRESSSDQPPMFLMIPFFGLFVSIGAFLVGAGVKSKTIFPLLFGGFFGGFPLMMSMFFNAPPLILASIALLMGVLGYRKSNPETWRKALASSTGSSAGGWTMGDSTSSSSDSSSSDSGSDFGGGDSGGGGASGSW